MISKKNINIIPEFILGNYCIPSIYYIFCPYVFLKFCQRIVLLPIYIYRILSLFFCNRNNLKEFRVLLGISTSLKSVNLIKIFIYLFNNIRKQKEQKIKKTRILDYLPVYFKNKIK